MISRIWAFYDSKDWFVRRFYTAHSLKDLIPQNRLIWLARQVSASSVSFEHLLSPTSASDLLMESSPLDFAGVDLSRIPNKAFMQNDSARNATKLEVLGLLDGATMHHEPPLSITSLTDTASADVPRYQTTHVVRLKGNGEMKARLRHRCDTSGIRFRNFAPETTVEKYMVRILISPAATNRWSRVMSDAPSAFLQSQTLATPDRYISLRPPCLDISGESWGGSLHFDNVPGRGIVFAFSKKNLVWGEMRSFALDLTADTTMREAGYYQHRLDICVFPNGSAGDPIRS